MKLKRILKIIGGLIVFFTLPTFLLFGFLYLKYDQNLPQGQQGPEADELARNMLEALNVNAYINTDYLEWTFKGIHHYKWFKTDATCEVSWDHMTVTLDFKNHMNSKVSAAGAVYNGKDKKKFIDKAINYFNNDSFWLVAPYKLFDPGVERRLVKLEEGKNALLVTYTSGGSTPGDSYLWHLNDDNFPKSFQMWVRILPIKGLEASWDEWITTESGAHLPTLHNLLFLNLDMGKVKGLKL